MNLLVIGSGAIGCYYGFKLSQAGVDVSLVARSDYAHIKANGIHLKTTEGEFHFQPKQVYSSEYPVEQALTPTPRLEGTDIYTSRQGGSSNGLQRAQAPSPAGEGSGEENKNTVYSPHPNPLPDGRGDSGSSAKNDFCEHPHLSGEGLIAPDYVMLCIKVVANADRVALLKPVVGPHTAIVLLSNGIDIEREIAEAFPDNEIISGLAFICVTRTAPGQIWHQAYGNLSLGRYPTGVSDKVQRLCEAYQRAGVKCSASDNITTARWQKCVWNAPFNPLSVLTGLKTGDMLRSQEPFIRAIMQEVCAIAAAVGHPLPEQVIEKSIDSTHKMPPYKTSMLVDFEAGHPLETEAILGNAVRAAHQAGVAIPHLETIYALMKLKEQAMQQQNCD